MTEFIAVDGEALPDKYNLLASSLGGYVYNEDELRTEECFDFLLQHSIPGHTVVCYGLNYDVNNWLRNLRREHLEYLWENHHTTYKRRYKIWWVPGKWFQVKKLRGPSVRVCEVLGFFQGSFISALQEWGIPVSDHIEKMKAQRGTFTADELEEIISYCQQECISLVELMNQLQEACYEANCEPQQWIGAGALAGKMLKDHNVSKVHSYDVELSPTRSDATYVDECIRRAYFGGRVELLRQGMFHHVKAADLRSAYPWAITQLPDLQNRILHYATEYKEVNHGIWHVAWKDAPGQLMPFPVRHKKDIYYPTSGIGWYHACEVQTALTLGYTLDILEGYILSDMADEPFDWVRSVYDLRAQWKREGRAAQRPLKLGLNSLYGKFAQGVALDGKPKWQSYFWAGEITARVRARMLHLAHRLDEPIMFSTDGLFYRETDSVVSDSDELGAWETTEYDSLFAIRPGVYMAEKDGKEVVKSRGFHAREVDFQEIHRLFETEGVMATYRYKSKRFIGLGSALMRRDFGAWRSWEIAGENGKPLRCLNFLPSSKDVRIEDGAFLPFSDILPESEPYESRIPDGIDNMTDPVERIQADEQPMKV